MNAHQAVTPVTVHAFAQTPMSATQPTLLRTRTSFYGHDLLEAEVTTPAHALADAELRLPTDYCATIWVRVSP
jgi:hypothetical protein